MNTIRMQTADDTLPSAAAEEFFGITGVILAGMAIVELWFRLH
jgi:hypothetical protein